MWLRWFLVFCVVGVCLRTSLAMAGPSRIQRTLFQHAATVREKISGIPEPTYEALAYQSCYERNDGKGMRGFCNWLIPGLLMVGQYPGLTPESNGPSYCDVNNHIRSIIQDGGVSLFCSLQSEVPSQLDEDLWERSGGKVYLPASDRKYFPRPFTQYAPLVESISTDKKPAFLHFPIPDLNEPSSQPLQNLLSQLLRGMDEDEHTVYLHCWGGRGRAGLVGACLVSLIYPQLEPSTVLDLVQAGYETRDGAESMPPQLSRSPQTTRQREFVKNFILEHRRLQRYNKQWRSVS